MWIVVWNDERLQEFEESFENVREATYFMEDLPNNAQLYYEDDVQVKRTLWYSKHQILKTRRLMYEL